MRGSALCKFLRRARSGGKRLKGWGERNGCWRDPERDLNADTLQFAPTFDILFTIPGQEFGGRILRFFREGRRIGAQAQPG